MNWKTYRRALAVLISLSLCLPLIGCDITEDYFRRYDKNEAGKQLEEGQGLMEEWMKKTALMGG
ncbi:MAG: hypothetical protein IJU50_04840 [Lachnospiraceae bacterium]|nr:hypothetical protein [Lachnospiraceae bacterium]